MIHSDNSGASNIHNKRLSFSLLSAFLAVLLSACSSGYSTQGPFSAPRGELRTDVAQLDDAAAVRMAQRFENAGDLSSALNMYQRALQKAPENTAALLGMARIYGVVGRRAESARYYKRILQLQPKNAQAATAVAEDLIFKDRPQEAVRFIKRFMTAAPSTAALFNLLAIAHDLEGDHGDAQLAYAEGLGMSPDDGAITSNLALSFAVREDYQTAIALLERVLDEADLGDKEGQSVARQNLALVYALSGQQEAALDIARTVLSTEEVEINRVFYARLPELSSRQKARAVFLGSLPSMLDDAEEEKAEPGSKATAEDGSAGFSILAAPPQTEAARDAAAARIIRGQYAKNTGPGEAQSGEAAGQAAGIAVETPEIAVQVPPGERDFAAIAVSPDAYPPYWVQLGSYRSPERTKIGWNTLSTQFPGLLAGYLAYQQIYESETRGAFFRLMVQASETRSAANLVCQTFKIAGMDCLVIETGGNIGPLLPEAPENGAN